MNKNKITYNKNVGQGCVGDGECVGFVGEVGCVGCVAARLDVTQRYQFGCNW